MIEKAINRGGGVNEGLEERAWKRCSASCALSPSGEDSREARRETGSVLQYPLIVVFKKVTPRTTFRTLKIVLSLKEINA